ncbi:MAG: YkgJ family cysteine cluster protein [Candidatus Melainabacteria bacterium]
MLAWLRNLGMFRSWRPAPQSGPVRGKYYLREGQCGACGKCCANIHLLHHTRIIASLDEFERLKREFPEYEYFVPETTLHPETGEADLRFTCVHLRADQSCGIYADRPGFCRRYPTEHTLLYGGELADACGYRFTPLQTFRAVLGAQGRSVVGKSP